MHVKAFIKVRTHASTNHGASTVMDIPLGSYDSEQGLITVLERVDDPDFGVYFKVDMHDPTYNDFAQDYNEFLHVYVRPLGTLLKNCEEETKKSYIAPDKAFIEEARKQWKLSNDAYLKMVADQLGMWLLHGGKDTRCSGDKNENTADE